MTKEGSRGLAWQFPHLVVPGNDRGLYRLAIDSRGEPTVDLRSNIAAEARAKIVYERPINITDPGIKDVLAS